MHETMVAESLLMTISAESKTQNAKPVLAKISCGMLNAINDEILRFAFEAIAKGTPCEGMKLEIEHKPIQGKCRNCDEIFNFEIYQPSCPKCESTEFELMPDAPLILEEIELETE
ncbi:MAG: hydrogenase maturation nickel metallochaperone HypA [Phycisphaerae bacterium]|nr:hydrogenase maturation nickel metallochaperone HypA [Phycisphaerae bacterium]MDD5380990.1 hydrogenase maturation nickel metallochaperone HypA [Phycisphaerae bacterium]